jgi:phosphatidate phosphatase LPIN
MNSYFNEFLSRSDVFGHILPLVGKDWSHDGIAEFFKAIQENGYQFIYLSARAIGQSRITRNFLRNIKQCGCALPNGPLLISPDTLVTALYRFVYLIKNESNCLLFF